MQTFAADVGYDDNVGTIRITKLSGQLGTPAFSVVGETTVNIPWSDSVPMCRWPRTTGLLRWYH